MKRKIFVLILIAGFLFATSSYAVAQRMGNEDSDVVDAMPTPGGNGMMQRFMNRLRDMLGVCQGEANLTEVVGLMTYDGSNYFIDDVELHFGPIWYITSSESAIDYDEDGTVELISDELQGLVNSEVTVEGYYQSDNWMSVFNINGEVYRETGQPIWAGQHQWQGRHGNGPNHP